MLEVGLRSGTELATIESKTHLGIVSCTSFISFDVTNDEMVDRIWPIISRGHQHEIRNGLVILGALH